MIITIICLRTLFNNNQVQFDLKIKNGNEIYSRVAAVSINSSSEKIEELNSIIIENEKEIINKGTNVVDVLESMKEVYAKNTNDSEVLYNIINNLDTEMDYYLQYKSSIINNQTNNFGYDMVNTYYKAVIVSIIAGFYSDGLFLSGELLSHMLENEKRDSEYHPIFGKIVKTTNVISQIANNDLVIGHAGFDDLGLVGYIVPKLFTKIDTDAYNALGTGFMYEKKPYKEEKIIINICDRYDFDPDKDGLLELCYQAQERGLLIPFYTRIDGIKINGRVQYGYEKINDEIIITESGNTENVEIPNTLPYFAYVSDEDNIMPPVKVTKIKEKAFENNKKIKKIYIPEGIQHIGANAFNGCDNATIEANYEYKPLCWSNEWNGDNKNVCWLKEHIHNYEYKYVGNKGHRKVCRCGEKNGAIEPHIVGNVYVRNNKNYALCEKCGSIFELKDVYIVDSFKNKSFIQNNLFLY